MTKAPKTSTSKAKPGAKAVTPSGDKVEDAVVVEETPPKPELAGPEPTKSDAEPAEDAASETPDAEKTEPVVQAEPDAARDDDDTAPADLPPDAPEEVAEKPLPAPSPAPRRQSGTTVFAGLLLGGAAAAVIGFVAARYVVPQGWPFPGVAPEEDPVALAVEAQGTQIADLGARIDGLAGSVATLEGDTGLETLRTDLTARLDRIDESLAASTTRLDDLETRLAAVEKLAPEGSAAAQMAAEAYDRELNALREMFQGELAKIEAAQADAATLQAQAAESAQAAAGRAALAKVTAALDSGQPFDAALTELTDATGVAIPAPLSAAAAEGVPTLAALQEAFPPAARAALDASVRAAVESGEVSRFSAFLQTQLGTRSLAPKEGDDADAVLSRAEAALHQGDLGTALTELDALPEAGQPAMADWRAMAAERKAALDAGTALADELNAM